MRLLQTLLFQLCLVAHLVASPPLETQTFHSSDGKQRLQLLLPPAREEYEGDEPNRRYCIADKRGNFRTWFQLLPNCSSSQVQDLAFHRRLPIEFRIKDSDQFSKRKIRLMGRNLVRLIDPTGRYVIHVIESGKDSWIIATWTFGWSQESIRHQYLHAFISAVSNQ